ncbi:hypothetical protein QFC21_001958 [Naganishia friedmannii]|uniref:Uncharacterized protein n=1 Tax=Naganishia friedmannii TaxID=89922 RepID=A0ACC2VZA6_9TREE|nr:hypothetical protein QFC21_001958 [Naganishia friedmannii]
MSSTAYGDTLPAHHAEDSAQQHQPPPSSVPALTLTHQDLLNTANELYRRMEDPGFAQDDAYWTSLPVHLRNFIRNALPLAGNVSMGDGVLPGGVGKAGGQRAMYALAQQIVSAANTGMGAGVSAAAAAAAAAAAVSGVSYPNPGYAVGMAPSQPPPPPPPPAPYASSTRQQGNVPTQQMSLDDIASMPPDAMLYPTADGQDVGKGYGFHPHPDYRQGPPHDHGEMVGQDGMDGWGNAKRGTMPGGFVRGDDEEQGHEKGGKDGNPS